MCTRSMARSKPKVSVGQLRKLLSAVESDPSLYNEAESDMITSLNAPKWLKLSQKLNECSDGAELNAQSWKYVSFFILFLLAFFSIARILRH